MGGGTLILIFAGRGHPNSTPIPPYVSQLSHIFISILRRLVDEGVFTANQLAVSLRDEPFPSIGAPFCYLCPINSTPIVGQVSGGGRYFTGLDTRFELRVFTFSQLDEAYQDTNKTYGLYDLVQQVIDALQLFFPMDLVTGFPLTEEPIRMISASAPIRSRTTQEWVCGKIPFQVIHKLPLDTSTNV